MSTTSDKTDMGALAENVVSDFRGSTDWSLLSQRARDGMDDSAAPIQDRVESLRQLDRDRAELKSKKDLLPVEGYRRLEREALERAEANVNSAGLRFDAAYAELKEALIDDALPVYDRAREVLAREELALIIGEAKGTAARQRAMQLVQGGSHEAAAILLRTPFGRSLMEARGVSGRDLEEFFATARTLAAGAADKHGQTDRQRAARAALGKLSSLGAAKGATGVRKW